MNWTMLFLLYISPSFIFLFSAGLIFGGNRNSKKHRVFSLLLVVLSLWFFSMYYAVQSDLRTMERVTEYIVMPLVLAISTLILYFWKLNDTDGGGRYRVLFMIPGAVPLLLPFSGGVVEDIRLEGPMLFIAPGSGVYVYGIVLVLHFAAALVLTFKTLSVNKGQAKLWFIGMGLFLVWTVTMTMVWLLKGGAYNIFGQLIPHGTIFWAAVIFISMHKHGYMPSYEKRYNILFRHAPVGIVVANREGDIYEASPAACEFLGLSFPVKDRFNMFEVLPRSIRTRNLSHYREMFDTSTSYKNLEFTVPLGKAAGSVVALDSEFMQVENEKLQFIMIRDITPFKRKEDEVRYLAYFDSLTGLYNRVSYNAHIRQLIEGGKPFAMILIDMDKFKEINDNYGHLAGDQALCFVAERLKAAVGPGEFAARLGGDEFVILASSEEGAERVVKNAKDRLEGSYSPVAGGQAELEFSYGVACYPKDGTSYDELFRRADSRMYMNKKDNAERRAFTIE